MGKIFQFLDDSPPLETSDLPIDAEQPNTLELPDNSGPQKVETRTAVVEKK